MPALSHLNCAQKFARFPVDMHLIVGSSTGYKARAIAAEPQALGELGRELSERIAFEIPQFGDWSYVLGSLAKEDRASRGCQGLAVWAECECLDGIFVCGNRTEELSFVAPET